MKDSDPDLHLIRLLADGRFHSGGDLGEALGVSRAAIWKRLQRAAEAYGLSVESVRGKGYRLSRALDPLDPAALRRFCSALFFDSSSALVRSSTNIAS